jgi:hypothetical protein
VYKNNLGLKPDPTVPLLLVNNVMRLVNLGITVPLCGLLIYRHYLQFQHNKMKKYIKIQESFRRSVELRWALVECLLHLLMSVPYVEWNICYFASGRQVCNPFSDFIVFVAVFRFYLLMRVYFQYCKWTQPDNLKVCDQYEVRPSIMWVMRCQFKKSPYSFLGLMIISMTLLMAYCMRVFERAYYMTSPMMATTDGNF